MPTPSVESFSRVVPLPRTDAARVRAAAQRMGIELRYKATSETVLELLRICYDVACAGAATARTDKERQRWYREIIRAKHALGYQDS